MYEQARRFLDNVPDLPLPKPVDLKPKPRWLPERLWWRLVRRVVIFDSPTIRVVFKDEPR